MIKEDYPKEELVTYKDKVVQLLRERSGDPVEVNATGEITTIFQNGRKLTLHSFMSGEQQLVTGVETWQLIDYPDYFEVIKEAGIQSVVLLGVPVVEALRRAGDEGGMQLIKPSERSKRHSEPIEESRQLILKRLQGGLAETPYSVDYNRGGIRIHPKGTSDYLAAFANDNPEYQNAVHIIGQLSRQISSDI